MQEIGVLVEKIQVHILGEHKDIHEITQILGAKEKKTELSWI